MATSIRYQSDAVAGASAEGYGILTGWSGSGEMSRARLVEIAGAVPGVDERETRVEADVPHDAAGDRADGGRPMKRCIGTDVGPCRNGDAYPLAQDITGSKLDRCRECDIEWLLDDVGGRERQRYMDAMTWTASVQRTKGGAWEIVCTSTAGSHACWILFGIMRPADYYAAMVVSA